MAVLSLLEDVAVPDISDPSLTPGSLALPADSASIERGPFIGAPVIAEHDVEVEIVNLDATYSHVDWVTGSSKRSILRPLSEPGSHSITIQNDSPELASIDVNTPLRYWYKGRPAAVGICEPQEAVLIADPKDLTTQWSGRLVEAAVLGALQVYPSIGVGRKPIQQNRNLDYTEPTYDDSAWVAANLIGSVETARFLYFYLSEFVRLFNDTPDDVAKNFPDPFAALLSAPGSTLLRGRPLPLDSGGDHYVRQWVSIASNGSYDGYLLGDDSIELAIDGVPVDTAGTGFMATSQFTVDLTAGDHLFAMHINNRTDTQVSWSLNPGGAFNPGFGAWTLFRGGITGVIGFVAHSDGTAKILPYAPRVPGMTFGRAIRLLIDEAANRGCTVPTLGFTDTADSDGNPWQYGVVSTRVMNDVYSTLKEQSVANIDFSMRTGGFVLDAWNFGAKGATVTVPFAAKVGSNPATMRKLTRKGGGPVTNVLLESTAYGWDERTRDSSISVYGRQEAPYSLGASNSPVDAQTIADGRLDIVAVPRYQYELIHDTLNAHHWAFNGFDLGDRVPLTPPGESATVERVASIAIAEGDATGRTVETVSLRDVVYYASPIEQFVGLLGQWAKKMIPGTGRGSWPETQPVTPPAVASRLTAWQPGDSCCGFDDDLGVIANNPATPTPEQRITEEFFFLLDSGPRPCSGDMALTATVETWDTDSQGQNSLQLVLRQGPSPFGANFDLDEDYTISGLTSGHARLWIGTASEGNTSPDHVDITKPMPGDVFNFTIIGDALTAYRNGSVILSTTRSGITMPTTFQAVAFAGVLAAGNAGGPYECRAAISFTSYC